MYKVKLVVIICEFLVCSYENDDLVFVVVLDFSEFWW